MGNFDESSYWMGRDARYGRAGGVAGAGLGLGIAGTALGLMNSTGFLGGWGNGWGNGWGRNGCGCGNGYGYGWNGYNNQNFDMAVSEALAQKDSRIAQLEAEKYADGVGLGVYKYFDAKIAALEKELCDQKVFNATVNGAIGTIGSQIGDLNRTVSGITRTAVPESSICDFDAHSRSSCNTCQRTAA